MEGRASDRRIGKMVMAALIDGGEDDSGKGNHDSGDGDANVPSSPNKFATPHWCSIVYNF